MKVTTSGCLRFWMHTEATEPGGDSVPFALMEGGNMGWTIVAPGYYGVGSSWLRLRELGVGSLVDEGHCVRMQVLFASETKA